MLPICQRAQPLASLVVSFLAVAPRSIIAQQRLGDVSGRITAAGSAVVGARVAIEMPPRVAIANDRGSYTLRGLPAGNYDIVVTALGYKSAHRAVTINANESTTLDVPLERGSLMLSSV